MQNRFNSMNNMKWLVIKDEYLNFLRQFEERIPMTDYGTDKYKPFFGILFETDVFCYVTQVSHPKDRHYKLKESKDFKKLYNPNNGSLMSVINLNYMFPILKTQKEELKYKNIEQYRNFINNVQKSQYINLLRMELNEINKRDLAKDAIWIYNNKYDKPNSKISQRCLDYKKLEEKCKEYQESQ